MISLRTRMCSAFIRDLKPKMLKKDKFVSNIIDNEGHQYVDLVMEGGGVLGIALVGYVHVLEEMGIRFLSLGGASAGSINALLMAAGGEVNVPKASFILDKLAGKNLFDFVDGDSDAKDFVKTIMGSRKAMAMLWKGWQVIDNFTQDYGLNPGEDFFQWVKDILEKQGIKTTADLHNLLHKMPAGIRNRDSGRPYKPDHQLALIASDVTTNTKVEFPAMADLYWDKPLEVNPACFVRASMSIPLFFHPFRVKNIPNAKENKERWHECVSYEGELPEEVLFIDGGIMSNFPIDIFHDHIKVPTHPTFGVKLGVDRRQYNKNTSVFKLLGSIFHSARQVHDFDFILRNPDYKHLVCSIQTGDHDWLNFNISDEDKIDLFVRGAECASAFLRDFDWKEYRQIREASVGMFKKDLVTELQPNGGG